MHQRFNPEDTFEVIVGQPASNAKHSTMHTSVVTGRSEFLAASLRAEPDMPAVIQLETQDPELFQEYVNCLHHGPQALRQWAKASVAKADANPDANMIVGEIMLTSDSFGRIPTHGPVSLAYASTAKGDPLRKLLRDYWIYQSVSTRTDSERLRTADFPAECVQDIAIELLEIADTHFDDFAKAFKDLCSDDVCRYHHHSEMHPDCDDAE